MPDEVSIGTYAPARSCGERSAEEIIARALDNPVGSRKLEQLASDGDRILIVVDDNTRNTPTYLVLPEIVERLIKGGVKEKNISLLVALGTHRPMTAQEKIEKYGQAICERFQIYDHRSDCDAELVTLGSTERGTEIVVNKRVLEADFVIGVGQIFPHRVAGYSGGCKIIQPGVSGLATTGRTHWLSAQFESREILGKPNNPVRQEMEAVARRVGLDYIVNTVQDRDGKIVECVAGDPVLAHRRGCEYSRRVFAVEIPYEADIVVCEAYPFDLDLWQAAKGLFAADVAVRKGGVIVLIADLDEGVAPQHPLVEEIGYRSAAEIARLVQEGRIEDLTVAAHLMHVGRIIVDRATTILVSRGITASDAERLGFAWAANPGEGLSLAREIAGLHAKVVCFKNGGEILPIIKGAAESGGKRL